MDRPQIAILTLYYHNYNYGGLLQAFALQKAISLLGYESVQISYQLETGYDTWNPIKAVIKKPILYLYHYARYGGWFKESIKRQKMLSAFANNIPHTDVVSAKNISKLTDEFDCFICGSDQIWNPIGWQPTLFLSFLPEGKKRISYAASIARNSLTDEQYSFMKKYLSSFSAISVREKKSADMLNNKFSTLNVQTVPDPVFLLDITEWKKLVPKNKCNESFIFAYFLGSDTQNRDKAIQYAKKCGLRIVFASYLDYKQSEWDNLHRNMLTSALGVEEFLWNIENASLVLTDSFHAAVFSGIFRTPFYALPRFSENDKNSMNSRLINLVEELNIPTRYTEEMAENYYWSDDELQHILSNLNRLREQGLKYLKSAVE